MISPFHFNQPITVHSDNGDLPGLFVGLDETGTQARVTIYRDKCPQAFIDAHKSKIPQLWVRLADVEERQ